MRFPPSFIERLRTHFLMSEVIGKRMPLKKHGREYQGLCPFHNEKSPSFTVNDEKAFFHCFGCGAHGDAIEFVRRFDRLTYPEAIEQLARDAGLSLPTPSQAESRRAEVEKTLYDVLEAAAQWFEKQLHATNGTVALDYVTRRGLKPETLRAFRVGYAPDDRTALHAHLTKAGFSKQLQTQAGLIVQPEEGPAYDRFRGRVIFPICNASGKVIAFGGRLLGTSTNKALPKYLNSPETPVFKKGEVLFNLDLAKRPAREANMAVVMEGYMDVVSSYQGGVTYALATLGTAVTAEHLRLLWQIAKEPVICLDGDTAGFRAMMRAAEVALPLVKPGYSLRFAILPKGEDPDTYIQKNGKAAFDKILGQSKRLSQILWDTMSPQFKIDLPEGRAALEAALKQLCDKILDPTVRTHYYSYFKKLLWQRPTEKSKAVTGRSAQVEQMLTKHHSSALDTLVQRLLNVVLKYPSFLHKSHVEEILSRLDIRSPVLESLRIALMSPAAHAATDDVEAFTACIEKQLHGTSLASLRLSYVEHLSPDDASYLWNETLSMYEIVHLNVEAKELEDSLGQSMNEAILARLVEVKEALHKAQSRLTFAPAESDIT